MQRFFPIATATSIALTLASPLAAQENQGSFLGSIWKSSELYIGAGYGYENSPYLDAEDEGDLTYLLAIEHPRFHIGTDEVTVAPFLTETSKLDLVLAPRSTFNEPDDSVFYDSIDRDLAIEAGLRFRQQFGLLYGEATALADISGAHDGFEARARLGTDVTLGPVTLDLSGGVLYRDSNLNTYLFGVADNALSDAFDPGDSLVPFADATLILSVTDHIAIFGGAFAEFYGEDIEDSPLVEDAQTIGASIGLVLIL